MVLEKRILSSFVETILFCHFILSESHIKLPQVEPKVPSKKLNRKIRLPFYHIYPNAVFFLSSVIGVRHEKRTVTKKK